MKLIFLGDSTMQYNDETTYPQVGWPQGLTPYLGKDVQVFNFAKNGRSTKTFMNMGHFDEAMKVIDENSVVVIEFGHNDGHTYDPERFTTPDEYKVNLRKMINDCKKKGAKVVLLSPIYRRHFKEDGTIDGMCHAGYHEKAIELAKEDHLDFIDMTELTKKKLVEEGPEKSKKYFMQFDKGIYPNYPDGMADNTHLVQKGADMIAGLFVENAKGIESLRGVFNGI